MDHPYNGLDLLYFVRQFLLCRDFSVISIKELRELIMLLFLSEFGVLTQEQIHLIILFTVHVMSNKPKNSLTSIASRLNNLNSFQKIEKDNISLITFSKTGPDRMLELLKKLFSYLKISYTAYINESYLLERTARSIGNCSVKPHSLCINTTIIFSIFCRDYRNPNFYLRKEMKLSSLFPNHTALGKRHDDIYPDIIFMPSRLKFPVCALEVDLGTESIDSNSPGSILQKIKAYTGAYNHFKTDVFFLFEDKKPYITEETKYLRNGYRTLGDVISHRSFAHEIRYLELILSMTQAYNDFWESPPISSINDLLLFMQRHITTPYLGSVPLENTYLYELLVTIAKYVDCKGNIVDLELDPQNQGQLPPDELLPLLNQVKETMGSKRTVLFAEENPKHLVLKRRHTYKAFMNSNLNATNLGKTVNGVMAGMVLVLSRNSRLWKKIAFIYFNETVKTKLGNIIHNLGIVKLPVEVNNFKLTRPLIVDCLPNNYRNSLSLLSMRNTFRIGDIDICVENISEDLGGFYRVQSYLKLPFGARPNTLVIALVDESDYLLANGEKLQSGSIFYLPNNNRSKNTPICSGEYAYWPYIKTRLNKFVQDNNLAETNYYLPLSLHQTQELIFLTYHDWNNAIRAHVTPWIYDHDDDRLVPRKLLLPDHTLESHILSKYKNSYCIYDWK